MGNSPSADIPSKSRRLVLVEPHPDMAQAKLAVEEVDTPTPRSGQVLIKVTASPINPSDYGEWMHVPPPRPGADAAAAAAAAAAAPKPQGHEGCGVVVSSGGGFYANSIVGKRVGFTNLGRGQGAYSEYVVVSALQGCFPLPDELPTEAAASHFINPYTAYGILDTARTRHGGGGTVGLVHTAAASQLGQMLVKLCAQQGNVNLINVVRREEQAATLRELGAEHVVVTGGAGAAGGAWEAELKAKVRELKVTVAFDAVAGAMSGALLDALPPKTGVLFVYGRLSNEGCANVQPLDLIYRRKKLEGWLLPHWLSQGGTLGTLRRLRAATASVHPGLAPGSGWAASTFEDVTLDQVVARFKEMYASGGQGSGFTNRKLRIRMDGGGTPAEGGAVVAVAAE